jgi:putative molybdopterin biosynthesis protein
MQIRLSLEWHVGPEGEAAVRFDPDLFRILRGILEGGSVRSAAAYTGLSYRHVWGLLQRWEGIFGRPLAVLERGRGATLTSLGERLLWAEARVEGRLSPDLANLATEVERELAAVLAGAGPPVLRMQASHGLAIAILRDLLRQDTRIELDLQFRSSIDCLRALSMGRCELAGFHVPEGALARRVAVHYRRWCDARIHQLIHVVTREQGLMVPPGNPKGITGVPDLGRPDVSIVNRHPGSGSRLVFDELLVDAGISPQRVRGYELEEYTHLAVAALVAGGAADTGFGIQAAAARFGLEFLPLVRERYVFAVRRDDLLLTEVRECLGVLASETFRNRVDELPGYSALDSGRLLSVDEVLAG